MRLPLSDGLANGKWSFSWSTIQVIVFASNDCRGSQFGRRAGKARPAAKQHVLYICLCISAPTDICRRAGLPEPESGPRAVSRYLVDNVGRVVWIGWIQGKLEEREAIEIRCSNAHQGYETVRRGFRLLHLRHGWEGIGRQILKLERCNFILGCREGSKRCHWRAMPGAK
jgi:hypothetical protein